MGRVGGGGEGGREEEETGGKSVGRRGYTRAHTHACVSITSVGRRVHADSCAHHNGDASSDVRRSQSAALRALLAACCAHTTAATGTHVRARLRWEPDTMVAPVG